MATFVLIHAAFHGDWVWRGVSEKLSEMGHGVIIPNLTADQMGNEANLSSHVMEILRLLSHIPNEQVIVVSQSYGGLVATALAARIPSKISHLIYVDAVLPEHGKSMLEIVPPEFRKNYCDRISFAGGTPVISPISINSSHIFTKQYKEFISQNLVAQPLSSFTEPVDLLKGASDISSIPKHYIHCSLHSISGAADLYAHFAYSIAANRSWRYRKLPIGFYGLLITPENMVAAIIEAVEGAIGGLSSRCLQRVLDTIEENLVTSLPLAELAHIADLSLWHFSRSFKKSVGISPHAYLNKRRIERAAKLLADTDLTISDIALLSGFGSASRFSVAFRSSTSVTPYSFRKRQLR